jgi:hypothetical protein
MAEQKQPIATGEVITPVAGAQTPIPGTAVTDQLPGAPATVSKAANAGGGIAPGNFVETDIDEELFRFNSDDTPLMNLMLKAKKVKVESPVVEHYMIDEPRSSVTTTAATTAGSQAVLPLSSADQEIPRPYGTLVCQGVNGYDETGQTATPGKPLMLFVTGVDATTNNPIVRAVNGPKTNATDEYSTVPVIAAGTVCTILSNALYETQKEVDPDLIVPKPELVYLQKRGMNQIVSDYFDSQKKRVPFTKAIIAEQAIANFKVRGNRTLWAGRKGKFKVNVPKMGAQDVYFTEGIRWQFKKELQHSGTWTFEQLIALAKMFFTGEDVPKTALLLAGKNLLEEIQCIDFSNHPEVSIDIKHNPKLGWDVTNIHTVFGDIEIKREPTLDRLGWSNSGALIGEDRLVHYQRTTEHSFNDKVEGEEATRTGILVWDALALKGSCHIWIDGEGGSGSSSSVTIKLWNDANAPAVADVNDGDVFYFLKDYTLTDGKATPTSTWSAQNGQMWQVKATTSGSSTTLAWSQYQGTVYA